uniref:Uncharacterized protein n=1 Tax=Tetranychus urticae TaxID=32264 RepID=T1K224_TETUR
MMLCVAWFPLKLILSTTTHCDADSQNFGRTKKPQ